MSSRLLLRGRTPGGMMLASSSLSIAQCNGGSVLQMSARFYGGNISYPTATLTLRRLSVDAGCTRITLGCASTWNAARWSSSHGVPPPTGDTQSSETASSRSPTVTSTSSSSQSVVPNKDDPNAIVRVKRMPLTLIEEVPLPSRIMSEIELLMTAWCEEHARQYALIMFFIRACIFFMLTIIVYVFYRTQISAERTVRGVENMPEDLRIGNVVYFDITENGLDIGRVVIGLLTEQCPLYCEYFHRRCTGSGGNGDSFRGMRLAAMIPRHAMIFGDGREMTHDVPGFNPNFLPTESTSGLYRGALTSIAVGPNKESPNFAIHMSAGDYKPQVFGLVIGGYDVIERVNSAGVKHGNAPKKDFIVAECGELCTLDKSFITPLPWKLFHNISHGYDTEKYGEPIDPSVLEALDTMGGGGDSSHVAAGVINPTGAHSNGKPWWRFW